MLVGIRAALMAALGTAPASAQHAESIRGVVVDAATGRPIPSAVVSVRAGVELLARTLTDADGGFRVPWPDTGRYTLGVRAPGYRPRSVERQFTDRDTVLGPIALERAALALDAVVVTAARREQRLADVPVSTEVISRRDLEASGAADLAQVLLDQTGIQVQGGIASGTSVLLQGLGDERILVLLDGQPMVGRIGGQLDLARLPVAGVERVEIVRGPQSTLYGSDAMGGVINVITRDPPDELVAAEVAVLGGSDGRREATLRVGSERGPVRVSVDAGRRLADLVSGRADSADASQARWDGGLKADVAAGAWMLLAAGQAVDERQRWRTGQLWFVNHNLQWNARLGGRWRGGSHAVSVTMYATEFRHHARRSTIPEPPDSIGERETQALGKLEALYGYSAGRHAIDAGVELARERIVSDRVQGERRSQLAAEPFTQHTLTLGAWSVATGARASFSDRWDAAVTPRVALRWRVVPEVALRAGVGFGYRAPDFKELDIAFLNIGPGFGYVVRGSDDLRPEHSRNVTAGIEVAPGRWFARAQGFATRFTDFIETVALPDSGGLQVFSYANRAAGWTRGVDAEGAFVWRGLRVEGGYAWLATRDDESGGPLLGRPDHSARAGVSWVSAFGLRARAGATYSGRAPIQRLDDGTTVNRDGFLRVDVRAAWTLPGGATLSAGIENVLAARPADWPGFTGRQVYAGVAWSGAR